MKYTDYRDNFLKYKNKDMSVHDFVHAEACRDGETFMSGDLVQGHVKQVKKEWKAAIDRKKAGKELLVAQACFAELVKDVKKEVIDVSIS